MGDCKLKRIIVFLVFQEINIKEGISKKIMAQVRAFNALGYKCILGRFVTEDSGKLSYYIGEDKVQSYGKGVLRKIRSIYSFSSIATYLIKNRELIKFVYIRYTQFSSLSAINLFKKIKENGISMLLEIPTYPYDGEFRFNSIKSYRILEEKWTRQKLMSYVDKIVTFSKDQSIFKRKTININNSINLATIPLRKVSAISNDFIIIGVAGLSFWHGYDRVIEGIKLYLQRKGNKKITFHVVGGYPGSKEYDRLKKIVENYGIENNVVFHGTKSGKELDELFNYANIAVGCLGCHRKGIKEVQSLKNVEYAARGIPFIYSEDNQNFDTQKYVMKIKPDDSPIDIEDLIEFIETFTMSPEEIRNTVSEFTWENQMRYILNNYEK